MISCENLQERLSENRPQFKRVVYCTSIPCQKFPARPEFLPNVCVHQEKAAGREEEMEKRASALEAVVESLRQDLEVGGQTGGD